MKIIGALVCLGLSMFHGWMYDQYHTDVSFIVANMYIIAGIILACGVKK